MPHSPHRLPPRRFRRRLALAVAGGALLAGCSPLVGPRSGMSSRYAVEPLVAIGSEIPDLPDGKLLEVGEAFELAPGEIAFWARVRPDGEDAWALLGFGRRGLQTIATEGEGTTPPHADDPALRVHLHRRSAAHNGTRIVHGGGRLVLSTSRTVAVPVESVLVWDGEMLRRVVASGDVLGFAGEELRIRTVFALGVGGGGEVLLQLATTESGRDALAIAGPNGVEPILWGQARLRGLDRQVVDLKLPRTAAAGVARAISPDGGVIAQTVLLDRVDRPAPPVDRTIRPGQQPPLPAPRVKPGRRPGPRQARHQEPAIVYLQPGAARRVLSVDDPDPLGGEGKVSSVALVDARSAESYVAAVWRDGDEVDGPGVVVHCHRGACQPLQPPSLALEAAQALAGKVVEIEHGEPPAALGQALEVEIESEGRRPGVFLDDAGSLYLFPIQVRLTDREAKRKGHHVDFVLVDGSRRRYFVVEPFLVPENLTYRRLAGPRPGLLLRGAVGGEPGPLGFPPRQPPSEIGRWFLDLADLDAGLQPDPLLPTRDGPSIWLGDVATWRADGTGIAVTAGGLVSVRPVGRFGR